jgi:hypothetical protein
VDFNQAIALDPDFAAAYTDRVSAYRRKIEQYQALIEADIEKEARLEKEQRAKWDEQREAGTVRGFSRVFAMLGRSFCS